MRRVVRQNDVVLLNFLVHFQGLVWRVNFGFNFRGFRLFVVGYSDFRHLDLDTSGLDTLHLGFRHFGFGTL